MNHVGLALKEIDGNPQDIFLDDDGNLCFVRQAEAVGQHVKQRLKTHYGEWFLDKESGVKWLDEVLGKNQGSALAEPLIKDEVLNTHGVTEIVSFSSRFDTVKRQLENFSISVMTEYDVEASI